MATISKFEDLNSENFLVVYSSLFYCLLGIVIFIQQGDLVLSGLFVVAGVSAFLHHSYPQNQFFRILDWVCAILIIYLIITGPIFSLAIFIPLILLLLLWGFSFYSFHIIKNKLYYTVVHSIWHIVSAICVFFLN